jgi:perosamine synthetase
VKEVFEIFEEQFGHFINNDNVVACSSGTAALHLALESLHIPEGGEVIMSNFNMIACARAVHMAGLVPVFVDCTNKMLIDPELVEAAITPRTNIILATHIYGRRCDMQALAQLSAVHNLFLVEDLAEAHGIMPHPSTEAACWSFYKNKIIAGEEGGAVAFHPHLRRRTELARSLRSLGFTPMHDFQHIPRGHNYRMSNLHAEAILANICQYEHNVKLRRYIEDRLKAVTPIEWMMPDREAPWVYDIRIPGLRETEQNAIVQRLNERGVKARHAFKPMSMQDEFAGCAMVTWESQKSAIQWYQGRRNHGEAYRAAREVIYLPLHPIGYSSSQEISTPEESMAYTIRTVRELRPDVVRSLS